MKEEIHTIVTALNELTRQMYVDAERIEQLEAALREKDNIAYIIDGHGITHNTFTIVYKEKSDD
jgi:hypothetical protein